MMGRRGLIGVELGGLRLRAAQRSGRSRWRVASVPAGRADSWTRLAGAMRRAAFVPAPVAISACREHVLSTALELPPASSGAPLNVIAKAELARAFRVSPEALVSGWWEVPQPARSGPVTHAIAAGMTLEHGRELSAAASAAEFDCAAIDLRCNAIGRALAAWTQDECVAVLDVGWNAVTLIVLLGPTPVFERSMDLIAPAKLFKAGADRLGLPLEIAWASVCSGGEDHGRRVARELRGAAGDQMDQLVSELSRSASFVAQRYAKHPLRRAVVLGECAAFPGLPQRAGEGLGVPVTLASMPPGAEFMVAAGMALYSSDALKGAA